MILTEPVPVKPAVAHWPGAEKLADSWETGNVGACLVIPAKAGIQAFQRLLDPGSPLRYGRDDGF